MRFSVITPSYNGGQFLETSIKSVLQQKKPGIELEYIVIDGESTDNSHEILKAYEDQIDHIVVEKDTGPANAINKGFTIATGEVISWLNTDDIYFPGTLSRVGKAFQATPNASFCFGSCPIINESGSEIRRGISLFKELFFPISSRFIYQCINYFSQPAIFFKKKLIEMTGFLREDMVAAWDYDFFLRLWRHGQAVRIKGSPLSAFRWHEGSISGRNYLIQFKEEYEAAKRDAGNFSPQSVIHYLVRWAILGSYEAMSRYRRATINR